MPRSLRTLNGRQKAAILMISLGSDAAAKVYKHLSADEVEELTFEIANLPKVEGDRKENVLEEFRDLAVARDYMSTGGIEFARDVLEQALGAEQAEEILMRLSSSLQVRPFHFARKADPSQIVSFLQDEHPQTMALVLSYLDAHQAALVLSSLPGPMQADIARRIASMESTSPDVIYEVEQVLESKLSTLSTVDHTQAGGVEAIVKILNDVDRGTEKNILDALENDDPGLADEIKKRMFVFDDIILLDSRSIQRIIRDCEPKDLQLALKVSSEQVQKILFENMSKRMADTFREEMEFMGPVRLRDVEEAQQRIVGIIRRLEDLGEIIVARGGGDEIIV